MTMEEVIELLRIISDFSDEEIDKYHPFIEIHFAKYKNAVFLDGDKERMLVLVAAKIYYEISKMQANSNISSFKAGDITITSPNADIERAKSIYLSALENASDLVEDIGFAFRSV